MDPQINYSSARKLQLGLCLFVATFLWGALEPVAVCAKTLEIGIEHTEILPSVSQDLRPGRRFSLTALENEQQSNEWIKLPDWLCGTWRIGSETAVLMRDFKKNTTNTKPYTYNARNEFPYGMQQDRTGGIWHYIGTPYHSKTTLSDFDEYHLVRSKVFNRVDEQAVTFTTVMTVVRVEYGHQIKESYQQESITTYSPISGEQGFINLSASTKSFDDNGQPSLQTDNVAKIKQIKPFAEVKTYHGTDMRQCFREFLLAHGWTNLLPD